MKKTNLIIVGIILAFILVIVATFISVNNGVVDVEEQVEGAMTEIEIQEKRRIDLIPNLVDVVQQYAKYESETLAKVVEMRTAASEGGNVENAGNVFKAVAEAYPELKADTQYQQLMTELSLTENKIAEARSNYTTQLKTYNKYIRKFPNSMILGMAGYEAQEYERLEFGAPSDAPTNLFD